ncbi:MAG: helix-hairpin-helix domain-containing protein [Pyrinomonadaceae bacterium]
MGAIDINRAAANELEKLPGIGPKTANEIIAFRSKYGRFRKPEHLMLVRGISDKRFRKFRRMVKTE